MQQNVQAQGKLALSPVAEEKVHSNVAKERVYQLRLKIWPARSLGGAPDIQKTFGNGMH